jgi:hypothetical protein
LKKRVEAQKASKQQLKILRARVMILWGKKKL